MAKARRILQKAHNLDKKRRFKNITEEEEKIRHREREEEAAKPVPVIRGQSRKRAKRLVDDVILM